MAALGFTSWQRWAQRLPHALLPTAFLFAAAPSLLAQAFEQGAIVPPYYAPDSYTGNALAIDGDWMVVGAAHDASIYPILFHGAAYLYQRDPVTAAWTFRERLYASDPARDDAFGTSVAIAGDVVAIGAVGKAVNGIGRSGAVYVFRRDPITGTYAEEQKLVSFLPATDEAFGASIAVEGDLLLVGAPGAALATGYGTGTAYVFRRDAVTGLWNGETQLDDNDGGADFGCGSVVAIEGDTAVVASPRSADNLVRGGSVDLWSVSGTHWTQGQELLPTVAQDDLYFGASIALDGDRLAIGSPEEDLSGVASVGAVDVFKRSAGVFSHEQHLPSQKVQAVIHFGQAVALHGGMLVAGAPQDLVSGSHSGSAWIYRLGKKKNGPWHFDTELGSSLGLVADNFGNAVALDDLEAVIAARYTDTSSGRDSGELFLFHAAELVLTINPTQPAAGATMDLDLTRGNPGELLLLAVEAIDGVPLFVPVLYDVFGADHAWHAAIDAPDPLFGITASVRAWKIGAGGPLVRSQRVDVDL